MNNTARIYRAEILRAVLGPKASELKAHDLTRLNQIADHLAQCEDAQAALRAKGYGRSGMTFMEIVRKVPDYSPGILKQIFRPVTVVGVQYKPRAFSVEEIESYLGESRY